jgi:selenocysteine-specific elongation factor
MERDSTLFVPVIFGTAGHIDHGKTCLIKALTGTDADRLKEEKERGISIELGFAFLDDRIAFIDVPGHEKFIRNMVAGAATIDYAMLIVAADDGVMPQTREHLDILTLLGVQGGLVVITKVDLADEGLIELVRQDVMETLAGSVLEGAPILEADSQSGRGVEDVRQAIVELAATKRVSGGRDIFRMPIDRVFSLKGHGTVVTGSVLSGGAAAGERLELLPAQREVRVKGLHSQNRRLERVIAGQRAGLNLANIGVEEITRGDVLASPGALKPVRLMYAKVKMLASSPVPLKNRQPVHLHMGTADLIARLILLEPGPIKPGAEGYVQLRLEASTAARRLDRFIIRRYGPLMTIGGGIVLDPNPSGRYRKKPALREMLVRLDSRDTVDQLLVAVESRPFATPGEIAAAIDRAEEEIAQKADDLVIAGDIIRLETDNAPRLCPTSLFQRVLQTALSELGHFHRSNPLKAGMPRNELVSKIKNLLPRDMAPLFIEQAVKARLLAAPASGLVSATDFTVHLTEAQKARVDRLERDLEASDLMPPSVDELAEQLSISSKECRALLTYLVDIGQALCLGGGIFFSVDRVQQARRKLAGLLDKGRGLTVSEIREAFDSTRKYVVPLLTYFDSRGWTRREGDLRFAGSNLPREAE